MRCANCGTELIPGKAFCHACGTRVATACPRCGASLTPGFRFCPDCGLQLAADGPAPAPARSAEAHRVLPAMPEDLAQKIRASGEAAEGERKQVTVLFCDLAGSTALAERLDPEEYHDLLEQYLELAFREIYRFDGIVNQLAGDGFMALFGAPVAHEDAPQRAVRAALDLQRALTRLNERLRPERGLELYARVGIHTGPVVVGAVGNDLKMDYSAIGDTTNLAARLEALAEPGAIFISEATFRLVRGVFRVRPAGPFAVKGKREPVTAYAVLGLGDATSPMALAAERGLTPFVGRAAELAQIEGCFRRLHQDFAQVVTVVGDAGSGKSRLVYELKQHLAGEPVVYFEARCSAWNQMLPYAPFVTMLKQYFGLVPDEPAASACERIARQVRAWDPQLDQFYPYLCHMLALPVAGGRELPPDDLKRETFQAVGALIMRETQRTPVILIIEDLQWMDEPSREMLDTAINEMGSKPWMLLVTHRLDYQPAWRTHAALTQLRLRRLGDGDIAQIATAIAGGDLPAEILELILHKAEGSPFLAEEVTRSLLEEGNLSRDDGHYRLARPLAEVRIPGTVQEVVAARLDRLGPDAKRVVQVAAVLGRQFSRDQLAQLLSADGVDVARELDELERRGIVHRKSLFSTDEYRFGESITQEVAYEGLLLKQRRQLHERVAQLLEAAPGEATAERATLLAHHFARSENRPRTVAALLDAARAAEKVPSYRTAARLYHQAWEAVEPQLGTDADGSLAHLAINSVIGLSRMIIIYGAPDPGDAEALATRMRALAEERGDTPSVASLLTFAGMLAMNRGRDWFASGLAQVEEGLALAQRAGLVQAAIGVSRGLAWSYLIDGRFAPAQRTIDGVVAELERAGDGEKLSDLFVGSTYMRCSILFHSDRLDESLRLSTATYELGRRASNRMVQSGTSGILAQQYFLYGRYLEAKRWAAISAEAARTAGNVLAGRNAAAIIVLSRLALGEPPPSSREVEALTQDLNSDLELGLAPQLIIRALLALGHRQRAEGCARGAYAHAAGRLRELYCLTALGDALTHRDPAAWAEAERCYTQAISLAEELGARTALAAACLGAGELAVARGAAALATRHLQHALTLSRELGLGHYQQLAEQLLAADAAPTAERDGAAGPGHGVQPPVARGLARGFAPDPG